MTGGTIRSGTPTWWVTINPSDLRNPVVLRLVGENFGSDALPAATAAVIRATATSNPVAIARFFHNTCSALFTGLLGSNSKHMGVLGDISNHYGVVESNGRGMLHLHALVWAKGNVGFANIRDRILNDSSFAARMISFLESTIVQSVESMPTGIAPMMPDRPHRFSTEDESDDSFCERLDADSNAVAAKVQMH
jgi:helitron helicase-like protein